MESPVRKMQKRNDYNRHKLLRKIKRRRKAEAEQLAHAAEKELLKKTKMKMPKFEDGKDDYYSYMERLANKKAKEWGYKSADEALAYMLNDNTYDYETFYRNDPEAAKLMLTADPDAHFSDIGKTVYHPTFSKESAYSGRVSDYNPKGTEGGSWGGNGTYWGDYYAPSVSLIRNGDFNYFNTWKYLKQAEARPTFIKMPKFKDGKGGKNLNIPRFNMGTDNEVNENGVDTRGTGSIVGEALSNMADDVVNAYNTAQPYINKGTRLLADVLAMIPSPAGYTAEYGSDIVNNDVEGAISATGGLISKPVKQKSTAKGTQVANTPDRQYTPQRVPAHVGRGRGVVGRLRARAQWRRAHPNPSIQLVPNTVKGAAIKGGGGLLGSLLFLNALRSDAQQLYDDWNTPVEQYK